MKSSFLYEQTSLKMRCSLAECDSLIYFFDLWKIKNKKEIELKCCRRLYDYDRTVIYILKIYLIFLSVYFLFLIYFNLMKRVFEEETFGFFWVLINFKKILYKKKKVRILRLYHKSNVHLTLQIQDLNN